MYVRKQGGPSITFLQGLTFFHTMFSSLSKLAWQIVTEGNLTILFPSSPYLNEILLEVDIDWYFLMAWINQTKKAIKHIA